MHSPSEESLSLSSLSASNGRLDELCDGATGTTPSSGSAWKRTLGLDEAAFDFALFGPRRKGRQDENPKIVQQLLVLLDLGKRV